jgi:hypothetical protein
MDVIIGLINLMAVAVLFLAWKRRHGLLAELALVPACAAWILWSARHGPEYATVYWFVTLTLFGWTATFLNRDFNMVQASTTLRRRFGGIDRTQLGRVMGRVVLAGPLAGLAGLLPWMAWAAWIPGVPANRLVAAIFLFIASWTLLAFWALASSRPCRPIQSMAGLIAVSGILLILGVQG